jgi:hypothetical protein
MSNKVAEIQALMGQNSSAAWVTSLWSKFTDQRVNKEAEWLELRKYIHATDTTTTANSSLPWKNSTTLPKLCQIRDNLYANYMSALMPNDNWINWEAHSVQAAAKAKRDAVETYMRNKVRESNFRQEVSKLVYDYIDYGNAIVTHGYESRYKTLQDGSILPSYVGPVALRISPEDIVFNPLSKSFDESYKVVRSIKTIGELKKLATTDPDQVFWEKTLENRENIRGIITKAGYSRDDFNKASMYTVDGFGDMYEYIFGDHVEILEFFGDYYDKETGEIHTDRVITITDRSTEVRNEPMPSWMEGSPFRHVGWRPRQDNLWAMGPLDNLVGLQYRLDHLENLKADAMDLAVHPPLVVQGEVEEFVYGPGIEISIDENGGVSELGKNLNGIISAANEMQAIEDRMELYAGAPREAAGIRTPGEKTLGEVMQLATAAGRIFQEKVSAFEIGLLEPLLNDMLECARRNLDGNDVVRSVDSETGLQEFKTLTKEDITAAGVVRPVGARHFAKQSQDLQNLLSVMNSPMGQMIQPHTNTANLAKFVDDITGLTGYNIFKPKAGLNEAQESQDHMGRLQETSAVMNSTDPVA